MDVEAESTLSHEVVAQLVAHHREFLRFLEARVRDRAAAEDILQAAFVRSMEKAATVRDTESVVPWFYRLLRNAIIDHFRAEASRERRQIAPEKAELELAHEAELQGVVCACVDGLVSTLKPEYAEMIRRVDLQEQPVAQVEGALGITPNNAMVRLHRARQGLKKQLERTCGACATHGCLDCRCAFGEPSRL